MSKQGKYYQLNLDETRKVNLEDDPDYDAISPPKTSKTFFTNLEKSKKTDVSSQSLKRFTSFLSIMVRLYPYNQYSLPFYIAVFTNLIVYSLPPIMSIYLSHLLKTLNFPQDPDYRSEVNLYCLYFLFNGIATLICQLFALFASFINAERIVLRIRSSLYKKILSMPVSWFDVPGNKPGALMSKLSTECIQIQRLAGSTFGILLGNCATMITALIIGFATCWQLTLVSLPFIPLLVIANTKQSKMAQGFSAKNDAAYKHSWSIFSETICNMRTVASCCGENNILKEFDERLKGPSDTAVSQGRKSGLSFGISQAIVFFTYAYVFYMAAVFMNRGDLSYSDMFRSIFSIIFAATSIGQSAQFLPDLGQSQQFAEQLFAILDHKPEIDIDHPDQNVKTPIKGDIEFKNIWFKYPTRDEYILYQFNLKINANSKIALLGASGCGKSTLISLLLRFYDPEKGQILIDGVDIKKFDIHHLRRSFGVVSQEPTLFNCSIRDNIKYPKPEASDVELVQSAREANCLKFIEANEFEAFDDNTGIQASSSGFDRIVGLRGSRISGGQKQRIAIARAIITKPNVLLLDEATSALDSENEKIVQESLDHIMKGKTCIVVTHRISAIRDADQILFFVNGAVAEQGNYEELIKKKGYFYRLERRFKMN